MIKRPLKMLCKCSFALAIVNTIACSTTIRDGDIAAEEIYISPELTLLPYLKEGSEQQSLTLKEQLTFPWHQGVEVRTANDAVTTVNNCEEFFTAEQQEAEPVLVYEFAPYRLLGLQCTATALLIDAKPALQSYVNDIELTEALTHVLPAELAFVTSKSEAERIASDESVNSWAEVYKIESIEQLSKDEALFGVLGGQQHVTVLSRADFDADGVEDILLRVQNSVEGGSYSATTLYVLTRYSADQPFELLSMHH